MPKYIAILKTTKPFTPEHYPTLFLFFERLPKGIRLRDSILAFTFDGGASDLCDAIYEHLGEADEATIFKIADEAAWRLDKMKDAIPRDQQMREFLDSE